MVAVKISDKRKQTNEEQPDSEGMKKIKIELNMQFEQEAVFKKKIYELDLDNENVAFELFSKQLAFTRIKNKNGKSTADEIKQCEDLEREINHLKANIDVN
jgi:hypothetical protein